MEEQRYLERIRKRELRDEHRGRRLAYEQKKRNRIRKKEDGRKRIYEAVPGIIREDNKKPKKPDKKPGAGMFLSLYSYISRTAFDKRDSIPANWKPKSFNAWKQHVEFLRSFVYPYPLPEILVRATHEREYASDGKGHRVQNTNCGLVRLAKKWVSEIASGGSFYKNNAALFTRAEAHYFLCSKMPYEDCSSIIKLYFYAKCRARAMSPKLSMIAAGVFGIKFMRHFKNSLVESFLDLIARTPEYRYDRGMLGDLCDFVLEKIRERQKDGFSFSGRTISSAIKLANEWHELQRREAEQAMRDEKQAIISSWKGMGIGHFRHESEEFVWTIYELKTAQDLTNEGRKMKNCVGIYARNCATGRSAIFTVERAYRGSQQAEKAATLEVQISSRAVIQAKGKCNSALPSKTMSVIARWAASNRIKVQLQV